MATDALANLARIGQLKVEEPNLAEVQRMLTLARTRLGDAQLANVSVDGRFTSIYGAGHAAALAALRWHGYRSENRFMVFQCLTHPPGVTCLSLAGAGQGGSEMTGRIFMAGHRGMETTHDFI